MGKSLPYSLLALPIFLLRNFMPRSAIITLKLRNNQFEWTSASDNNSYISDETLYIVPTLTSDHLGVDAITNGYTLNLTTDGTCTSSNVTQCGAVSNSSLGTMINPVMSARLSTKGKASIKYGKVEVEARMPTG
jgi:beta-glucanase (GH16 family)